MSLRDVFQNPGKLFWPSLGKGADGQPTGYLFVASGLALCVAPLALTFAAVSLAPAGTAAAGWAATKVTASAYGSLISEGLKGAWVGAKAVPALWSSMQAAPGIG